MLQCNFCSAAFRKLHRKPTLFKKSPPAAGHKATIQTTMGDIVIKLFFQECPKTVENFTVHAKNGYYDSTIVHRVIQGFMVQMGDPLGDGTGSGLRFRVKTFIPATEPLDARRVSEGVSEKAFEGLLKGFEGFLKGSAEDPSKRLLYHSLSYFPSLPLSLLPGSLSFFFQSALTEKKKENLRTLQKHFKKVPKSMMR